MIKIGLLKEGKIPIDRRVALTPTQVVKLKSMYSNVEIVVQSSTIRCYSDEDYSSLGIDVVDEVSNCDILLGVKEVPFDKLIEGKIFFFFSHTTKKQSYNQKLLATIVKKRVELIDYEELKTSKGTRLVAFGRYAGIVGAYNGILAYGIRFRLFKLRPAHKCSDLKDLYTEFSKIKLPPIKIVLTGTGRVADGAVEVLDSMNISKISSIDFLSKEFDYPVYTQLHSHHYNNTKNKQKFKESEFYSNPDNFYGDFLKYAKVAHLLIAGSFWNPKAPVLFTKEEAKQSTFKIKLIADITCDIKGSIPSTLRPSTISQPIYDYSPTENSEVPLFSNEDNITVMAVDNLPCELPKDASIDFGNQLIENIFPHLLNKSEEKIIECATITKNGKLTPKYAYLQNFLDGK